MFDEFTRYPESRLRELAIPELHSKFLSTVGLPTWCAPNMHFGELGESWTLLPEIQLSGRRFLGLGEDRDDHAIALSIEDLSVWVLHEGRDPVFLARDVLALSAALHHFQAGVNSAVQSDRSALAKRRLPLATLAPFVAWISIEDPQALQAGSFWRNVFVWLDMPDDFLHAQRP